MIEKVWIDRVRLVTLNMLKGLRDFGKKVRLVTLASFGKIAFSNFVEIAFSNFVYRV